MSCLTNWPAGHNLSLLICGALSGCRACFLDFGFSRIPDFWKSRGCGFLLGVTTGKEVMFIKCAGSAGLSMLSAKNTLFSFACQALCLNSFQNAGFTLHEETVPGRAAFFLSLLRQRKIGNSNVLVSSALSVAQRCLRASVSLAVEEEEKLCYLWNEDFLGQ